MIFSRLGVKNVIFYTSFLTKNDISIRKVHSLEN